MFNVAVINSKDLIKYLAGICLTIIIIFLGMKLINNTKKEKIESEVAITNKLQEWLSKKYEIYLNNNIPGIMENSERKSVGIKSDKNTNRENVLQSMLNVELAEIIPNDEITNESNGNEQSNIEANKEENTNLQVANTELKTEVVTQNPINATPTDTYGKVQIRNQTGYVLNDEMLVPNIELNKSNIIIFHTHTCESYTPTEQNSYEPSGTFRTTDLNYSVARVGDELTNYLINSGYNVVHDKTYHDFPAYSGSYNRSLQTVENLLKKFDSDIIIDLHRDAIGSNSEYAPTVKIGEDYAAQLMFVIGTDAGGLWHPNWNENLKFAIKIQEKAEELYPGLFKPIILRNSRYNQHIAKAANIIEVGATGNTLEQCLTSMKYLSIVLNESLK